VHHFINIPIISEFLYHIRGLPAPYCIASFYCVK
jgi:hypothetical protein